jgi:hypothetical protein
MNESKKEIQEWKREQMELTEIVDRMEAWVQEHVKDPHRVFNQHWKLESECHECKREFGFFNRRHHCRKCGHSYCLMHLKKQELTVLKKQEKNGLMTWICVKCQA